MHRHFQPFAVESRGFRPNAQKLTDNTENWSIFNIVIKYSLFGSWKGNYLKASISATFSRLLWRN